MAESPERWERRPVAAGVLRAVLVGLPIALGIVTAVALSRRLTGPSTTAGVVAWWAGVFAASTLVLIGVERAARRWLPLVALLRLSMLFPDRAPSRFAVARRAGSLAKLRARIQHEAGEEEDASRAAERILTLLAALQLHDRRTRGHAERVRVFTDMLAEELHLPEADRDRLRWAALIHDIGKLAVSADLLNKPAELSDEEWREVRRHPEAGMTVCGPLLDWLAPYGDVVLQHHERWDGSGYPQGLAGGDIAYGARIVAVADAYEVMTAPRAYKRAQHPEVARRELATHAGAQFDPAVVRAFLNLSLWRLRWVLGPALWLVQLPFIQRPLAAHPTAASGAMAGATVLALGAGGLLGPAGLSPAPIGDTQVGGLVVERSAPEGLARSPSGGDGWSTGGDHHPPDAPDDLAEDEDRLLALRTPAPGLVPAGPSGPSSGAPPADPDGTSPTPRQTEVAAGGAVSSPVPGPAGPEAAPAGPDSSAPSPTPPSPPQRTAPPSPPPSTVEEPAEPPAARGPTAGDDHVDVESWQRISIHVLANDVAGDAALVPGSLRLLAQPKHGRARAEADGTVTYTAQPGWEGTVAFPYEICDAAGLCDRAGITVTITRRPGPPPEGATLPLGRP